MNMGVDGHTTCILVFKNPVHDEWVSAGHIPEGQTIPSLDAIVSVAVATLFLSLTYSRNR
jgi:hypothetical protein